MSALVWDKTGERFYETGVSKGVLYPLVDNAYSNGVVWNGLINVNENPSGAEATDLYADNIKYATMRAAEKFSATIEAYTYPDEFAACDGSAEAADGVMIGQQARQAFGFSYVTNVGSDTDPSAAENYKLHLIYNCTASPSDKSYQTINESPDAITFSWEMESTPVNVDGKYKPTSTIVIDSRKADPEKLAALEAILYGSESAEARMPLPAEVITLMSKSA